MGLQEESGDMCHESHQALGVVQVQSVFQLGDGPDLGHCEHDYAD